MDDKDTQQNPEAQVATSTVDTSQLFQRDPEPPTLPPKKRLFPSMTKKKLLIILLPLLIVVLVGGGLVYAQVTKSVKPATEQSAKQADTNDAGTTSNANGNESTTGTSPTSSTDPTGATSNTANNGSNTSTNSGSGSSSGTSSGGTTTSGPKTWDISYTNNCYSPANITIKNGDTVRFTNNASSRKMEPASDDHPSHEEYSEFDAKNGISPSGTYSFTFTKTGSWGYHDHIKPSCTGVITVQ